MLFKKPILGHYYITEKCNCHCVYCDIPQSGSSVLADFDDVKANLQDLKKVGVRFVDFTGGEPLLHPQLPQMLTEAKKRKLKTTVTTNCLFYPDRASDIRGLVDFLHFSLDAMDEKENDRIRGKGSFRAVMRSVELAKSIGEKPDILFTATNENFQQIDDLVVFARREKLILIVNPIFIYSNQQPISWQAMKYLEKFYGIPFVYFNRAFHLLIRSNGNQISSPKCRVGDAVIVISPQNELLLPCYHKAIFKKKIHENLAELWQSPQVQKYRSAAGKFNFCQNCTINCYFDPSFLYEIDNYFWLSLISKARYAFDKYVRAKL